MSANTKIEWTDHTWSPVVGCSKTRAGCAHCYAIRHAHRLARNPNPLISSVYAGLTLGGSVRLQPPHTPMDWTGNVRLVRERLDQPKSWRKPARIFVNPMSDLFHEALSFPQIHEVWCAMTSPCARHHTFQILTKRYQRMAEFFQYLRDHYRSEYGLSTNESGAPEMLRLPQPHIWLGHSYSNQKDLEAGIRYLLRTPAVVRFASLEPLLAPVSLKPWLTEWLTNDFDGEPVCPRLDWVILGFESGPGARPGHPQWARDVRDECLAAGVPFLFKQWGEYAPANPSRVATDAICACGFAGPWSPRTYKDHMREGCSLMYRVGKRAAGRLLDGREWNEFPEVNHEGTTCTRTSIDYLR